MRPFSFFVGIAALISMALSAPASFRPISKKDVRRNFTPKVIHRSTSTRLPLKFVNNFNGSSINAYISGLDSNGKYVFVSSNGTLIYPSSGGSQTPVKITQNIAIPIRATKGKPFEITLPIDISSGRIYFVEGELTFYMVNTGSGDGLVQPSFTDPKDASAELIWGFVEFTYTNGLLYANISYVDFVGMILGMHLATPNGPQSAYGLQRGSVSKICNDLSKIHSDFPWGSMCIRNSAGTPVRVLSPNSFHELKPEKFADYWSTYVDSVWDKYSEHTLRINTQTESGNVACKVSGNQLSCNGDNRSYTKPSAKDIWGCNSGPFAIEASDNAIHQAVVPRLCAAFVRSTLLLEGNHTQPQPGQSHYYSVNPTNHYSRIVHEYESDGKGYAFSYDDVNPDGNENASGVVSSNSVLGLTVYVGGPPL